MTQFKDIIIIYVSLGLYELITAVNVVQKRHVNLPISKSSNNFVVFTYSGFILCMRPANERWCYIISHWLGAYIKWSLHISPFSILTVKLVTRHFRPSRIYTLFLHITLDITWVKTSSSRLVVNWLYQIDAHIKQSPDWQDNSFHGDVWNEVL